MDEATKATLACLAGRLILNQNINGVDGGNGSFTILGSVNNNSVDIYEAGQKCQLSGKKVIDSFQLYEHQKRVGISIKINGNKFNGVYDIGYQFWGELKGKAQSSYIDWMDDRIPRNRMFTLLGAESSRSTQSNLNYNQQKIDDRPSKSTQSKLNYNRYRKFWMRTNLNVDTFRNGDSIPEIKGDEEWVKAVKNRQPAWCYYKNYLHLGEKFGKLYNWYAVNDPRVLAPHGWHVPSDLEWQELIDFLGGENLAGNKMKSKSGWKDYGNGTSVTSFSGLPSGYRYNNGGFGGLGSYGSWWSSTPDGTGGVWVRVLWHNSNNVGRYGERSFGLPVCCIRDKLVD